MSRFILLADLPGAAHELQLHEALPWTTAAGSCCTSVGLDAHCVVNFFISFCPLHSHHPRSPPAPCRIRFYFETNAEEELWDGEGAMRLPALLSLEVRMWSVTCEQSAEHCETLSQQISVRLQLPTRCSQIPCFVGLDDDGRTFSADRESNIYLIRDVPTPMLLQARLLQPALRASSSSAENDNSGNIVCKLRAAEVTGMGIPGKVWDAGLALAGIAAPYPRPPKASACFILHHPNDCVHISPEEILVRSCSFACADGSIVEAAGWGGSAGVSKIMSETFEGKGAPLTVVELGAGVWRTKISALEL
jgi:hypothetical protein